jgi:hypothetical protein
MRLRIACLAAAIPLAAAADPFPQSDPKIGQRLLTEKNCDGCHVRLVGGDGSGIYTRPGRIVKDARSLVQRVAACNVQLNAGWFPEDEAHVAAYLNQKYYKFR